MNINWSFFFVLLGCAFFIIVGGIVTWRNWCLWKGWPTTNAIVQKNHVGTLNLLILDGAHKNQILELILGNDDPVATSFPVGKSILIKVNPSNSKIVELPRGAMGFLVAFAVWLSPLAIWAYKSFMV